MNITMNILYCYIYVTALEGPDILKEHCVIKHCGDDVTLHPNPGAVISVNNRKVTRPVKLSQGECIQLMFP